MLTPAHDVAILLAENGIGQFQDIGVPPWIICVNSEPDTPDTTITVYDTGGGQPSTNEGDVLTPSIQVRVRGVSQPDMAEVHQSIRELLTAGSYVMSSSYAVMITMTLDVVMLGLDEKNRFLMTANYQLVRIGQVVDPDYSQPEDWEDVAGSLVQ
jgi:hypothetical protein